MTQALADWGEYILADRSLQIQINIGTTAYPTELADDVVSFVPLPAGFKVDLGTQQQGATVSRAVAGIASGEAFPSPDITITLNQADLNSIYFPSNPSSSYQVPAGKVDLVSLFEHEIGHAIGFDGLRNQSGVLANAESVFDTWVNVSGSSASLVSPAEQNQYRGQPVPLTTGASNGANNYTLASGSLSSLSDDLMNQSLKPGQRYQISGLDLAAVETAGVPAGLGYYSPVGVNQVLAPVHFDSEPATFTVTPQSDPKLDDVVTWKLPGITNPTPSSVYQIQREIWLTTSAYAPNSQGFLFYSKVDPYVDTAASGVSGSGPSLLPASGTYYVTYVLSEQDGAGRYVQEQAIPGGTITFQSPPSAALTNYTPSQPDEGSDSGGQGDDGSSGENGVGSSNDGSNGDQGFSASGAAALPIFRFYDTVAGTHLFTQSRSEAVDILSFRPDLKEEVNNFGAVPDSSPAAVPVYRFFETGNGTHFFTADTAEFLGLTTPGSASYRPDLTYESSSNLYVDTIQETGDVAVYRLFDNAQGTQFLTGSQAEYQGLTTPGSSGYRSDLSPEGIAFYAPAGSSLT
ncbi:MAG: hypothetical protein RQ966_08630 [Acetobacteraceae bacterium]|nr:hypothetical protein [Acetobacteraceae bacterium]